MMPIRVIGFEYLTTLKKANFNVVETKIQEPSMIYKRIEWLCVDLVPLQKRAEDYGCALFGYSYLKKAASSCRHTIDEGKKKIIWTNRDDFTQSHFFMVHTYLNAM